MNKDPFVIVYSRVSQNVFQGQAASALPENSLKMQISSPASSPIITLICGLTKLPGNSDVHSILKTTVLI